MSKTSFCLFLTYYPLNGPIFQGQKKCLHIQLCKKIQINREYLQRTITPSIPCQNGQNDFKFIFSLSLLLPLFLSVHQLLLIVVYLLLPPSASNLLAAGCCLLLPLTAPTDDAHNFHLCFCCCCHF